MKKVEKKARVVKSIKEIIKKGSKRVKGGKSDGKVAKSRTNKK
jgi:hypothetical protein